MPIKVLVADDELRIAQTVIAILRHYGYAVRAAYDGDSAVEIALQWKPDIFLTDVVMPGTNGYAAAARVRAALPNCRVILHSTLICCPEDVRQPRPKETRFEFLPKPVHPKILLDTLAGGVMP